MIHLLSKPTVECCLRHNIRVAAYAPLLSLRRHKDGPLNEVVEKIAAEHSVTPAQVLLRWQIQKGYIPITATSDPERQRQQLDLASFKLSDGDMERIDDIGASYPFRGYKTDSFGPTFAEE